MLRIIIVSDGECVSIEQEYFAIALSCFERPKAGPKFCYIRAPPPPPLLTVTHSCGVCLPVLFFFNAISLFSLTFSSLSRESARVALTQSQLQHAMRVALQRTSQDPRPRPPEQLCPEWDPQESPHTRQFPWLLWLRLQLGPHPGGLGLAQRNGFGGGRGGRNVGASILLAPSPLPPSSPAAGAVDREEAEKRRTSARDARSWASAAASVRT
jgi:hypothetical protein